MRRHREGDLKLLARYLAGECDEQEEARVRARLAVDEEAACTYETLKQIWELATPPNEHIDREAAWRLLERKRQRLHEQEQARSSSAAMHVLPSSRLDRHAAIGRRHAAAGRAAPSRLRGVLSVAAVLAIGLLVAVLVGEIRTSEPAASASAPEARVYETAKGERATIRLTDGTLVHLNVESRLAIVPGFGDEHRAVHLAGEAFFDVVADSTHPFVIEAGEAKVHVLGTAFDVRSYPDEAEVQVVVASGSVTLGPRTGGDVAGSDAGGVAARQDTVILKPGELGLFSSRRQAYRQKVDIERYTAWRAGRLVFVDAPFDVVARELSRWYDLQVELTGATPQSVDPLKASFGSEPLSEILNVIAAALNLEYERERRHIIFRPVRQ